MSTIINQTFQNLLSDNKTNLDKLIIDQVLFGVNMTAVKLSDGSIGVASTLFQKESRPHKHKRHFGDFSPSKYSNQKVLDLFNSEIESSLTDTLRIAVLNGVSAKQIENAGYKIIDNSDPIDLIDISKIKTITIVGAFRSYIDLLSETGVNLKVLEMDKNMLSEEHQKYFVPANQYPNVIPNSDLVIITGLTLINNTIDGLLKSASKKNKIIVVGPSANIFPEFLFKNGVSIIGATKYTNPDLLFKLIAEGANAYHLFKYCAQKICIINE
ncbi:MAG: DUF364 domain-containing protein [Bacteroidales bacterium]|nr:DUF364 domain-containing protein [Bacteroidales bacterium]